MAYYPDLGTMTQIASGPRVRAIGWLSSSHAYSTGEAPAAFVERLRELCGCWDIGLDALRWPVACGPHSCEFCSAFKASGNIGVPAKDLLYVAPQMVAHYVDLHGYVPPPEFIEAVIRCPSPGSPEYAQAVRQTLGA